MKIAFGIFIAFIGVFLINLTVGSLGQLGNDVMHGAGLILVMGSIYFIYKSKDPITEHQESQE